MRGKRKLILGRIKKKLHVNVKGREDSNQPHIKETKNLENCHGQRWHGRADVHGHTVPTCWFRD